MEPGKLSGKELLSAFSGLFFLVSVFLLATQFDLVKYENTIRIITPIAIGIFGTLFALEQLRINSRKSKMDLFDKRFGIYDTVYKFISLVHDYGFAVAKPSPYSEKIETERKRYKIIQSGIKDFNIKITLSDIITDKNLSKKLNEYKKITLETLELKKDECYDYATSQKKAKSFSDSVKKNDEKLKEIIDTKLRDDFEKYFTIK